MKLLHALTMDAVTGKEMQFREYLRNGAPGIENSLVVVNGPIHPRFEDLTAHLEDVFYWKYEGPVKLPKCLRSWSLERSLSSRSYDVTLSYSLLSKPALMQTLRDQGNINVFYDESASWEHPASARRSLEAFDGYLSVSHASRILLERQFGLPEEKIHVVPNAMTQSRFRHFEPDDSEDGTADPRSRFNLLFVGRLIPVKGTNILLRSLRYLPDEVHATIVGDGRERNHLAALARHLGVADRVHFEGFHGDPAPFYRAADLFVFPSVREPFGSVVMEAGAARLPILSTRIDGIADIVGPDESDVLLDPTVPLGEFPEDFTEWRFPERVVQRRDNSIADPKFVAPRVLAERIEWLKDHPRKREEYAENLHHRVREHFTMDRVARRMNDFFREVA